MKSVPKFMQGVFSSSSVGRFDCSSAGARREKAHQVMEVVLHFAEVVFAQARMWRFDSRKRLEERCCRDCPHFPSPHVNLTTRNHSTTRKSWRSDAPIILPGWEYHTGGSRSKPTVHRCRPKTGGCGLLTRTQNEPTKQHGSGVENQHGSGASVSVPQPASSAQCVNKVMISSRSSSTQETPSQQKYRGSASWSSTRTRWTTTPRSGQTRCSKSRTISAGTEKSSVRTVTIALRIFASIVTPVEIR